MHRIALCLVFVASTLAAPRPAAAAVTDLYDTIDSAEVTQPDFEHNPTLTLRGVLAGTSAAITREYAFHDSSSTNRDGLDTAMHCQRLALLALSKPGKFQFGIGHPTIAGFATGCKLTRVAP
jgi:hypothetical protein